MKIRLRSDLLFFQRDNLTDSIWVIKDPLTFQHFLFSSREYFLLRQIDGKRSEEDIVQRWREHFRTHSLSIEQLRQFVRRLIHDKLVVVEQLGYGQAIGTEQSTDRNSTLRSLLASPLAIRFRGFNPTGTLRQLDWLGAIIFHPVLIAVSLIASSLVLLYTFGHFDDVIARLPAIEYLLSAQGLMSMVLTIAAIKILHELGHAMACRRFGGECFEIGVILLAFIPTLYCNVSDAWTFRERWKRIMVSFAGMYVEIGLAAIAAVLWLATPPGLLNALLFNVVLLCSVNTLLVNGNPLLRYDGYYMLADWWEKPNLSSHANMAVSKFWLSLFFVPAKSNHPSASVLVYGLLSFVYRWFVLMVILSGVILVLGAAGSYSIGYCVAGLLLVGLLAASITRTVNMAAGRQFRGWSLIRTMVSLTVIVGIGWLVLFMPLPSSVYCTATIEDSDPVRVYAPLDGQLVFVASNYEQIVAGAEVAKIESRSLLRTSQLKSEQVEREQQRLRELRRRMNQEPELVATIGALEERIRSLIGEQSLLQNEISNLTITAPRPAVVIPGKMNPVPFLDDPTGRWTGFVNDANNVGCYVSRGEHLLTLGNPDAKVVSLVVNEKDMDFVAVGQHVRIHFEMVPGTVYSGSVTKIQRQEVSLDQIGFDAGLHDADSVYVDPHGRTQLLQTPYRVELGNLKIPRKAFTGSTGRAKISIRRQSVAERLTRLIKRSLATKL